MAIRWQLFLIGFILAISSVCAQDKGKCLVCDSATNAQCADTPESITGSECNADSCFTIIGNDGSVKRGCVDTTNNKCEVTTKCLACTATTDSSCNNKKLHSCKVCDSSKDPNCSQWSDASNIESELCADGITKCIMQIKADKNIERRCVAKNDEACADEKKCKVCETPDCNKGVFPENRRQCYQCTTSTACANPSTNTETIKSLPCTLYDEADKCYAYGTSETAMARGCVSDTTSFAECQKVTDKCVQCDADNCNGVTFKIEQSLKCIQCKSDDANCAWGYTEADAKDCLNKIEYWQTESCYTNKVDDGKAERGCLYDAAAGFDCTALATCTSCSTGIACNKDDAMEYSCYKCRSNEQPACGKKIENDAVKPTKCRNPVTQANQGCYIEKWNDIVIRSCLVDADEKTMKQCQDPNYKQCTSCNTVNCNSGDIPNSAQSVVAVTGLLGLALLVVRFL